MLENITLGQYYPIKSPVHALDPRVKILLLIAYITGVFLVPDLTGSLEEHLVRFGGGSELLAPAKAALEKLGFTPAL